jgi:hypothetical protein
LDTWNFSFIFIVNLLNERIMQCSKEFSNYSSTLDSFCKPNVPNFSHDLNLKATKANNMLEFYYDSIKAQNIIDLSENSKRKDETDDYLVKELCILRRRRFNLNSLSYMQVHDTIVDCKSQGKF